MVMSTKLAQKSPTKIKISGKMFLFLDIYNQAGKHVR